MQTSPLPQPVPAPRLIPAPEDRPYGGVIELFVDATDCERAVLHAHEIIPVGGPGHLILVYPEWLPGFHSPEGQIELLAGLKITAGEAQLEWQRDPANVYAFHIDVPDGVESVSLEFQHLSPTSAKQGRVAFTAEILNLQWNTVILHPAGHYARQVQVQASLQLPSEWKHACAVKSEVDDQGKISLETCTLDVLVDSPLYAGRHSERIATDPQVHFNVFSDKAGSSVPLERKDDVRALVREADLLFGARHFDRYEYLFCLSDHIGAIGVEHHRSCEIAAKADLFSNWDKNLASRSVLCHEYVHSWNGKYRRGADSWQPCFLEPIRNSLMWVYEGLTQYWGEILSVRAGIVSAEAFRGSLALTAASLQLRAGHHWRPLRDTTRDPIIAARKPLPWPSWQRSEDYYSEGMLLWLEADMIIRVVSGDTKNLDDFASAFFGGNDGIWTTLVYTFEDVCSTLRDIVDYDWERHFDEKLRALQGPPLGGIEKSGWALANQEVPNVFHDARTESAGLYDFQFSAGLIVTKSGELTEVIWDSAAFKAGLRSGDKLVGVNGAKFGGEGIRTAIANSKNAPVTITFSRQGGIRDVEIACAGLRFPYLKPSEGRDRLSDVLSAKAERVLEAPASTECDSTEPCLTPAEIHQEHEFYRID